MTEPKGVIPLITRRINKNINKRTLAYGNENIFHRGADALFPSQRRTGEKPRTEQGSAEMAEQIETIFRAASSISRFKCFQKHS